MEHAWHQRLAQLPPPSPCGPTLPQTAWHAAAQTRRCAAAASFINTISTQGKTSVRPVAILTDPFALTATPHSALPAPPDSFFPRIYSRALTVSAMLNTAKSVITALLARPVTASIASSVVNAFVLSLTVKFAAREFVNPVGLVMPWMPQRPNATLSVFLTVTFVLTSIRAPTASSAITMTPQ